jgi:Short C-terminal domain
LKVGLLISGIVIMIFGVIGYFSVQSSISDCQSFVGQVGRTFSQNMAEGCQIRSIIQIASAVLFVVGIGLTIGGAVAKGEKSHGELNPIKRMREEYEKGYEETRPRTESKIDESKKSDEKEDNIKNIGILKERLAKGEITKEEYDDLKKEFL